MKISGIDSFNVLNVNENETFSGETTVPAERVITIYVNGEEIVTLLATPTDLKDLAVGFLFSEGFLRKRESIKQIDSDSDGYVWVKGEISTPPKTQRRILTSGCGKGLTFQHSLGKLSKIGSKISLSREGLHYLFKEMREKAKLYQISGGLHCAALCNREGLLFFAEDIGRHNAVDKVLGHAFLNSVAMGDKILITSGRVSSEMVGKAISARIPVVASRTSPTDASVELSRSYDVTLAGYVRAGKMKVYSKPERIN